MGRYEVRSGATRMVVQARDARCAALWAVHKSLQQVAPLPGDSAADSKADSAPRSGAMVVLADRLTVSPLGREGRPTKGACWSVDTAEIVTEWNQLMVALSRLPLDDLRDGQGQQAA